MSYEEITYNELLAYFGLMLAMGLNKDNKVPLSRLWITDNLMNAKIYGLVMSRERFKIIHRFLRFDDILTTNDRKKSDKLAKVSDMVKIFNQNCQRAMNINESATVDEQLLKLHSKFSFKQYIPSKPAKYGIKSKKNFK